MILGPRAQNRGRCQASWGSPVATHDRFVVGGELGGGSLGLRRNDGNARDNRSDNRALKPPGRRSSGSPASALPETASPTSSKCIYHQPIGRTQAGAHWKGSWTHGVFWILGVLSVACWVKLRPGDVPQGPSLDVLDRLVCKYQVTTFATQGERYEPESSRYLSRSCGSSGRYPPKAPLPDSPGRRGDLPRRGRGRREASLLSDIDGEIDHILCDSWTVPVRSLTPSSSTSTTLQARPWLVTVRAPSNGCSSEFASL